MFVIGLGPLRTDERQLAALVSVTRPAVAQAVTLVQEGCPPPSVLDEEASVSDADLLTVAGVELLVDRGAFPDDFAQPPDEDLVDRLCDG